MPDLNSDLQEVKSGESFLEKIARFIPGYDGYVNRDNSRELDTKLRITVASSLDQNKAKVKNVVLNLSKQGKLFETDGIDRIQKKLENVIAKFRSAERGYSGAFDVVKIKEDKLNQIYQFDAALLEKVNEISTAFTELENNSNANADIGQAQQKVSTLLDGIITQFTDRENLLRNL